MARIVRSLTDTQIRQAKPRDREYNLTDGDGLALRIKPSGSKIWLFNYLRPYTKRRTNLSFGSYLDVSLADDAKGQLTTMSYDRLGRMVNRVDYPIKWYLRSVEVLDDPLAHMGLGRIYLLHAGSEKDYANVYYHFSLLMDEGKMGALYVLGHLFELGLGVPKDEKSD